MEDVSRRIVNEMATCIKANVEGQSHPATAPEGGPSAAGSAGPASTTAPPVATAKPINAISLFFQVLWAGIRRLFGAKS
jgi:hypothetical protein